ncbi:TPA: cystatin-like fold lipoprotein [Staphylococcus aureus]|nr:cystatin-like fold lipoprotein [Staphylococcus aureus]MBH4598605.1 cystatin-like fold lipoprotein [Staphylococcus aureus]
MIKRILTITFILVISISLVACGKKYDKEIDEVSKLEKESTKDRSTEKFSREKADFKVYEDGKVIIVSYKSLDGNGVERNSFYKLNETTSKYEEDINVKIKTFERENKPDYKEENIKE